MVNLKAAGYFHILFATPRLQDAKQRLRSGRLDVLCVANIYKDRSNILHSRNHSSEIVLENATEHPLDTSGEHQLESDNLLDTDN